MTPLRIDLGVAQALGARQTQQDRFGVRPIHGNPLLRMVAVVADGMGGHAAGEIAAQLGVDAVMRPVPDTDRTFALLERFHAAQDAVLRAGRNPRQRGLGATLTALTVNATSTVAWCHLGDSRLTLFRGGQSQWLTQDHSLPGMLYAKGRLSEIEFDRGEGVPGLCAFLGMPVDREGDEILPVEKGRIQMEAGDILLLTSDGVHGALRKWAIEKLVLHERTHGATRLAAHLVANAVAAGGAEADNATCIALIFDTGEPTGTP